MRTNTKPPLHPTAPFPHRAAQFAFGLLSILITTGSRCPTDPHRTPTMLCDGDMTFIVPRGTCLEFQNPCGDHMWTSRPEKDGFRLEPPGPDKALPSGITVETTEAEGEIRRSICVAEDAPLLVEHEIEFVYGRGLAFGTGTLILTTADHLRVTTTVTPATTGEEGGWQLLAIAHGGVPPYSYSWGPSETFAQAPVATPEVTTEYTVSVQDAGGQSVFGSATVIVDVGVEVSASPAVISPGESSRLTAVATGGTLPYTFLWTPAEGLDDPRRHNPVATPRLSTTYEATVTDAEGTVRRGQATVNVSLRATASADPPWIEPGTSARLMALAEGGVPPYAYAWTPEDSLDDPAAESPVATPGATTRYMVTVTDAAGAASTDSTVLTVDAGPPALIASFTYTVVSGPTLVLDASASSGEVVTYQWILSWLEMPLTSAVPVLQVPIDETDAGTITLTIFDALGREASTSLPF